MSINNKQEGRYSQKKTNDLWTNDRKRWRQRLNTSGWEWGGPPPVVLNAPVVAVPDVESFNVTGSELV